MKDHWEATRKWWSDHEFSKRCCLLQYCSIRPKGGADITRIRNQESETQKNLKPWQVSTKEAVAMDTREGNKYFGFAFLSSNILPVASIAQTQVEVSWKKHLRNATCKSQPLMIWSRTGKCKEWVLKLIEQGLVQFTLVVSSNYCFTSFYHYIIKIYLTVEPECNSFFF